MSTDGNDCYVDGMDTMDTVDVSLGICLLRRTGCQPVQTGLPDAYAPLPA